MWLLGIEWKRATELSREAVKERTEDFKRGRRGEKEERGERRGGEEREEGREEEGGGGERKRKEERDCPLKAVEVELGELDVGSPAWVNLFGWDPAPPSWVPNGSRGVEGGGVRFRKLYKAPSLVAHRCGVQGAGLNLGGYICESRGF